MILLVDNYDSFTYNLVHLVGDLGKTLKVIRNDELTSDEAIDLRPEFILLSPGPCTPNEAGICLDLVRASAAAGTALFGVCLGLQSIVQGLGGSVVRAGVPMHGKVSRIRHRGHALFKGIPTGFRATRYHSLVADAACLPDDLEVIAWAEDDNEVMAVAHKRLPICGVQFHPESIASEHGAEIVQNFLGHLSRRVLDAGVAQ